MAKRTRITSTFSKNLVSLMKEKGISIRKAAEITGVSKSTIDSWRSGSAPENFIAVKKLAKALDVSFSYLLTGEEDSPSSTPTVSQVFDESPDTFFDGFARITIHRLIPENQKEN